jgi:hypothetical protein
MFDLNILIINSYSFEFVHLLNILEGDYEVNLNVSRNLSLVGKILILLYTKILFIQKHYYCHTLYIIILLTCIIIL